MKVAKLFRAGVGLNRAEDGALGVFGVGELADIRHCHLR